MQRLLKFLIVLVVLLAGIAGGCWFYSYHRGALPSGHGDIQVAAAGKVDQAMLDDVMRSARTFKEMLRKKTGVELQSDIQVYAAGSEDAYEQVLQKEFDLSADEAKAIGSISGGWTGGSHHVTAINGSAGVMAERSDRWSTTGHELFHQVQYELSGGRDTDDKSLFWLAEGSADYMGAVLADYMQGKSLQKWQHDTLDTVLAAPTLANPEQLQHVDMAKRKQLMQPEFHSYQVADLMTIFLLQQYGGDQPCAKLTAYYQALKEAADGKAAFAQVFGIDSDTFVQQYSQWWQAQRMQPAQVEFTARPGMPVSQQSLEQHFASARQLAEGRLGLRLSGHYDIVLAASQQDMADAAVKWCGIAPEKAQQLASASLWLENGSTVVVNAAELADEKQQTFTMGVMAGRLLAAQAGGLGSKGIAWLERGMGYIMGVECLRVQNGVSFLAYERNWRQQLQSAGHVPDLRSLATGEGWNKAQQQYGNDLLSAMAQLACAQLLQQHSWSGYQQYLQQLRRTQDGTKAYQQVYGQLPRL